MKDETGTWQIRKAKEKRERKLPRKSLKLLLIFMLHTFKRRAVACSTSALYEHLSVPFAASVLHETPSPSSRNYNMNTLM